MTGYRPTIGLEIHAELKTRTKMFCDSKNDPEEREPNANICPVCMGHPGTLPVINKKALEHVVRIGCAVGGALADYTEFDRKNYFYPDIPKGYQISQYAYPLVSGGALAGVELERIHLEEDTARSVHDSDPNYSLVDFNRAGVPLMELVTKPVIADAETAGRFARELQLLLRFLGASDANLEKGEMRVEANISVSADETLGGKVEVKNLNSFKSVERAIQFEIARQTEALETGAAIMQETRGWDESKQQTFSQRLKEASHDYRYFPDPDLPKLVRSEIPEFSDEKLAASLPELPWERRMRYRSDYGLTSETAEIFVVRHDTLGTFLEATARELKGDPELVKSAVNYITSDLVYLMEQEESSAASSTVPVQPRAFAALIRMIHERKLSSRGAKDTLAVMVREDGEPRAVAQARGLLQESDEGELARTVDAIIAEHAGVAAEYRAGKTEVMQFLIGQGMKATKGAANPAVLKKLLEAKLGG